MDSPAKRLSGAADELGSATHNVKELAESMEVIAEALAKVGTALARLGDHPGALRAIDPMLPRPSAPVEVAGVRFPGRVGLAAGVDKDGVGLKVWEHLGFGHIELGTVTAEAQPGNPQPRLFRLRSSDALINRMGFNNEGAQALADRLAAAGPIGIPVGVSIGKTKVTPVEDAITQMKVLDAVFRSEKSGNWENVA